MPLGQLEKPFKWKALPSSDIAAGELTHARLRASKNTTHNRNIYADHQLLAILRRRLWISVKPDHKRQESVMASSEKALRKDPTIIMEDNREKLPGIVQFGH